MIPQHILTRWRTNSDAREKTQLEDLLELRSLINEAKAEGGQVVMEMYAEAAPCFRITIRSLQNKLGILREYPGDKLRAWINRGIAMDTIRQINHLSDMDMTRGESPAEILDRVLESGNGIGTIPTADEVVIHVMEQNGFKSDEYIFNISASKLAHRCGIDDVSGFLVELRELVSKWKCRHGATATRID